jgi:hypothetical protein
MVSIAKINHQFHLHSSLKSITNIEVTSTQMNLGDTRFYRLEAGTFLARLHYWLPGQRPAEAQRPASVNA